MATERGDLLRACAAACSEPGGDDEGDGGEQGRRDPCVATHALGGHVKYELCRSNPHVQSVLVHMEPFARSKLAITS